MAIDPDVQPFLDVLAVKAGADWARSTLPRIPLVHGDFELAV